MMRHARNLFGVCIFSTLVAVSVMVLAGHPAEASDNCISLSVHVGVARVAWDDYMQYHREVDSDVLEQAARKNFAHEMGIAADYAFRCTEDKVALADYYTLELERLVFEVNTGVLPFTHQEIDRADNTLNLLFDTHHFDRPDFFAFQENVAAYHACAGLPFKNILKPPDYLAHPTADPCQMAHVRLKYVP